jgi:hypothetical protein
VRPKADVQGEAALILERMQALWEDHSYWQERLKLASHRCAKVVQELSTHQARLAALAMEIQGGCDRDGVPF